jgi:Ca2+-binding RTX toxin-like protein
VRDVSSASRLENGVLRSYVLGGMGPGARTHLLVLLAFALVLTLVLAPVASAKLIVGNKRDNKLVGTQKRDDIYGRGGRDVLIGFDGWDRLYGEQGDDILLGEAGADRLWGSGRDDTLDGGLGPDRLWPGWGTDVVDAGPGDDLVWAGETDAAVDSIDCGDGFDRVVRNNGDRVFNCEVVRVLHGPRPPGSVRMGTPDVDDVLNDTDWNSVDLILGLSGDDYLNGHTDGDILWGNEDDDTLLGDYGPDLLLGGSGIDLLMGESGNDRLWGGFGPDTFHGGDHDDELISIEADGEIDHITCGSGRDRVIARPDDVVTDPLECERVIRIAR